MATNKVARQRFNHVTGWMSYCETEEQLTNPHDQKYTVLYAVTDAFGAQQTMST